MIEDIGLPDLRSIKAPLRDVLRGLSNAAEWTEGSFKPIAPLLPGPVRTAFLGALRSFENAVRRDQVSKLRLERVQSASAFLRGNVDDLDAIGNCANVIGFALGYLSHAEEKNTQWIVSEAIMAARLRRLDKDNATSRSRAATVFKLVFESGALTHIPRLSPSVTSPFDDDAERWLTAALVWLLSVRAEGRHEEVMLLEMAMGLVRAFPNEDSPLTMKPDVLDKRLRNLARHL